MSENFKKPLDRPDRVLGDEWADWSGQDERFINECPSLFLGFTFAVISIINAVFILLYYLVLPRLAH